MEKIISTQSVWESFDRMGVLRTVQHHSYGAAQKRAAKFGDRLAVREVIVRVWTKEA